jgi:hypothetical protein
MAVKLTNTQRNVLHYVEKCIGIGIKKEALAQSRVLILSTTIGQSFEPKEVALFDQLFPTIASFANPPTGKGKFRYLPSSMDQLISDCVDAMIYNAATWHSAIMRHAIEEMHKHAVEYDMLSQMPPVRKTRKKRVPQTLVEGRASKVDEKVREWERKLKYAKTKLASYQKRQKYYTKKGAVA